ncbi:MAG: flagellar basal body P-ring protein FlgI [Mesorhizobium sp.]
MKALRALVGIIAAALAASPLHAADLTSGAPINGGYYDDEGAHRSPPPHQTYADRVPVRLQIGGPSQLPVPSGPISRIKDIASVQAARDNQLIGYGLVIGLQGTGDNLRSAPFTEQSVRAMLQNLGIATEGGRARVKNVAAVIVTANLPPFVQSGSRIDVTVSSLGDATSLSGGTLVMTPLRAPDGEIYAVAQGQIVVSGFTAQGAAETVTRGVPTSGRLPNGAIVEREVPARFSDVELVTMQLRNPDFSTIIRVTDAINAYTSTRFGKKLASEQDARTLVVKRPDNVTTARFVAELENLRIETDAPARVVIDERTGTIVIGQDVRISKVAISHGALTVRITEMPTVVQPEAFSRGETTIEPSTAITAEQEGDQVATLDGPNLEQLVAGLNRIGVKPDGIIAILQGIKSAGALQADLVLQ